LIRFPSRGLPGKTEIGNRKLETNGWKPELFH
jgi:hypothetical protein